MNNTQTEPQHANALCPEREALESSDWRSKCHSN